MVVFHFWVLVLSQAKRLIFGNFFKAIFLPHSLIASKVSVCFVGHLPYCVAATTLEEVSEAFGVHCGYVHNNVENFTKKAAFAIASTAIPATGIGSGENKAAFAVAREVPGV